MKDEERQKLIDQAKAMQEAANQLLEAAGASADTDEAAVSAGTASPTESGASPEGDDGAAETAVAPEEGLPDGLPDDTEEAIIDPPEVMDMRDELERVRDLLRQRGFTRKASSAEGEVWERPGPRGEPGFRSTLVSSPHGRIRMEIRDPAGLMVTQAEPATVIDCEIALRRVP